MAVGRETYTVGRTRVVERGGDRIETESHARGRVSDARQPVGVALHAQQQRHGRLFEPGGRRHQRTHSESNRINEDRDDEMTTKNDK